MQPRAAAWDPGEEGAAADGVEGVDAAVAALPRPPPFLLLRDLHGGGIGGGGCQWVIRAATVLTYTDDPWTEAKEGGARVYEAPKVEQEEQRRRRTWEKEIEGGFLT